MESSDGSFSSLGGDELGRAHNSRSRTARRLYRRHSSNQIARLEAAFKVCPHPSESVRRQLGSELGLEPRQVKFWFQNKRTQSKTQGDRTDNTSLRQENERMVAENFIIREALKNILCLSCGGPTLADKHSEIRLQKLKQENTYLKLEYQRMSQLLESYNVISSSMLQQHVPLSPPTESSFSRASLLNTQIEIPSLCQRIHNLCQQHMTSTPTALEEREVPTLTLAHHTHALGGHHHQHNSNIPALDQQIFPLLNHQDVPATLAPAAIDHDTGPSQPAPMDQDHNHNHNRNVPSVVHDFASLIGNSNDEMLPMPATVFKDGERGKMKEAANDAMEELTRLLRMNEPFWFRSTVDGKFILQRESYEKIFYKVNRLKGPRVRRESSKDSRLVIANGPEIVDMFLDSEKWAALFPTIVKRAYTIEVIDNGLPESRSGALQLMYAETHILAPLVPSREFYFLRYCMQVDAGVWVIADVSFNSSKFSTTSSSAWRFPSGCSIHDMNDGSCRVTWVEHVEVDDKIQTHRIFRDLICDGNAFGAERWVLTLERMCERLAFASMEQIPSCDAGGVITIPEGRRNVMQLASRMVKLFCGALEMSDHMEFPYVRVNNCGVRVSVRNSSAPGVPKGMVVSAATSFWLPLMPHTIFDFLKDPTTRDQWDVLCHGNPVNQLQHISNGSHPDNFTSVIRPFIPNENNMLLLQECCVDPLGCMVVYAPVDVSTINAAINGEDTSTLPILPSGFTVAGDCSRPDPPAASAANSQSSGASSRGGHHGTSTRLGGSLLTLVIQVLICSPSSLDQLNMDSVAAVNTLVTSTVENIKLALNCSHLD